MYFDPERLPYRASWLLRDELHRLELRIKRPGVAKVLRALRVRR